MLFRSREGNDLYNEMIESGVINLKKDTSKAALVFGQMNEAPGARALVALTGLTVAEYFRDKRGQDVLLFIDNIFRFSQAGSEVSSLLGVFLLPWVINRLWQRIWVNYKNVLLPQSMVQLLLCKRFMCLRTI